MKAYLSGAMEYASDEGSKWRAEITIWLKQNLKHGVYNPVLESEQLTNKYRAQNYRTWKKSDPERYADFIRHCVNTDLSIIEKDIDYIICLWNEGVLKGAGTAGEVTLAYRSRLPVYLVNGLPPENLSGWIMACSTKVFNDMDILKSFLFEKYKK
ncbi:MAG: hypothetical protein V3S48_05535 [Candidatus Neomarinimicrobiota bacterium]